MKPTMVIKKLARALAIEDTLQNVYVRSLSMGERLQHMYRDRPSPESAILLAGSGRSGTTWLRDLIVDSEPIQPIFEPLNPNFSPRVCSLAQWKVESPNLVRSHYLHPEMVDSGWHDLWSDILTGQFRNFFTDRDRMSFFPRRYLIKVIRANLMLGYVYDNFHPKIVYIMRHPCAVINSQLALDWTADVTDILKQEQLVEEYLQPWVNRIEKETNPVGVHAIWWSVQQKVALTELATRPHTMVHYEILSLYPDSEIQRIREDLGLGGSGVAQDSVDRPSRTAWRGLDTEMSVIDRIESWKQRMSHDDIRLVLDWSETILGPMYDERALPLVAEEY